MSEFLGLLPKESDQQLLFTMTRILESLEKFTKRIGTFTKLLNTNGIILPIAGSAGDIIYVGPQIPRNHRARVTDVSINFDTSTTGTVRLVVLDASGKTIKNDVSRSVSGTASGQAATVMDEAERLGLVIQVSGSGNIGCLVSGELQEI